MKDHGYKYIVMWGRELGSFPAYVQGECDKAQRDGAPLNATYNDDRDGRWHTTDDIASNPLRIRLGLEPLPPEHPVILAVYSGEPAGLASEFRFGSLPDAARWASEKGLADRVVLACYGFERFSEPVTVRLLPEGTPS